MVHCSECGRAFDDPEMAGPVASISGSIMGDEHIESYYLCPRCGVYTVEVYHDRFLGEEEVTVEGPLSRVDGDARVALIRHCLTPWDKHCRCEVHQAYWGTSLD
jgi:hypothetical protein